MSRGFRLKPDELRLIRLPLLAFGGALLLALLALVLAGWLRGEAEQKQLQARQKLEQIQAEAAEMQTNLDDFRRYGPAYRDLLARGIIGNVDRLQWVEVLSNIRRAHPELRLQYRIDAQRPLDLIADIPEGMRVFASRMSLQFQAPHEERMFDVLERLNRDARGLPLLRQCRMIRGRPEEGLGRDMAVPLETQCIIEWVTVKRMAAPVAPDGSAEAGAS